MDDSRNFELQLFNGREYVTTKGGSNLRTLQSEFAAAAPATRRLVLSSKAWPARPVYRKRGGSRVGGMSKAKTVCAYLAWAESRGVECVTFYAGDPEGKVWSARYPVRWVDPADILGPAPEAEPEGE